MLHLVTMNSTEIESLADLQAASAMNVPTTPAYVYSESLLLAASERAADIASYAGCKLLYTLKACALAPVLEILSPKLHGFAVSGPFELRVVGASARAGRSIHCYAPAYPARELDTVLSMADYVSLNSWGQLDEASRLNDGSASLGLRINPEMTYASDSRYDPCRPHSKLGVPLGSLVGDTATLRTNPRVDGLLIHSNCESHDLAELAETVEAMSGLIGLMDGLAWFNLGGGYYLGPHTDPEPLRQVTGWLGSELGLCVFIEPGTALVQEAGFLVTEVLDVFKNGGVEVALLDATTSHLPEVFEYGYRPRVVGPRSGGDRTTILAGRSCLAGDVIGEYDFQESARAGDRVAVMDSGAYSHSRATPFNGIPVPDAYVLRQDGSFELIARFEYHDFAARNGAISIATA